MDFKRKPDFWSDRMILQWHAMGKAKYLPLLINYILLPISIWLVKQISSEFYLDYAEQQLVFFVPLGSIWWNLLMLQQYVEGKGRELLYIGRSSRLKDVLAYYVIYIITLVPIFCLISRYMPRAIIILPTLVFQSFLYTAIFYMMSLLTESISYGFIFIFAFSLFSGNRIRELLAIWGLEGIQSVIGYTLAGIICFIGGEILERKKLHID